MTRPDHGRPVYTNTKDDTLPLAQTALDAAANPERNPAATGDRDLLNGGRHTEGTTLGRHRRPQLMTDGDRSGDTGVSDTEQEAPATNPQATRTRRRHHSG
jgi:hypothetical protein